MIAYQLAFEEEQQFDLGFMDQTASFYLEIANIITDVEYLTDESNQILLDENDDMLVDVEDTAVAERFDLEFKES